MKNLLLLTGIIFFTTSQSQNIAYGVKAGVNIASVGGSEAGDISPLTSFNIGGIYRMKLSERIDLQPELLYSLQGAKVETSLIRNEKKVTAKGTLKLHYVNIPVMVAYSVWNNIHLEAGPQFGFLVGASSETNLMFEGDVDPETKQSLYDQAELRDDNFKDDCKTLDLSLGAGASYGLNNGLFFNLRYNIGFTDIYKESLGTKNKNSVLQISAGYLF